MESAKMIISTKRLNTLLSRKRVESIRYSADETLCVEAIEYSDGSSIRLQGEVDGQVQITSYAEPKSERAWHVYPVLICACGWSGMEPQLKLSPRPDGPGQYSHCPACATPAWELRTEVI